MCAAFFVEARAEAYILLRNSVNAAKPAHCSLVRKTKHIRVTEPAPSGLILLLRHGPRRCSRHPVVLEVPTAILIKRWVLNPHRLVMPI
jgi:hypothetical protein